MAGNMKEFGITDKTGTSIKFPYNNPPGNYNIISVSSFNINETESVRDYLPEWVGDRA